MNLQEIKNKLPEFTINDYFRHLKSVERSIDSSKQKPLKVAFLRTYTVEMVEPILGLRLFWKGIILNSFWGIQSIYTRDTEHSKRFIQL